VSASALASTTAEDFAAAVMDSVSSSVASGVDPDSTITTTVTVSETSELTVDTSSVSLDTYTQRLAFTNSIEVLSCSGMSGTCSASLLSWRRRELGSSSELRGTHGRAAQSGGASISLAREYDYGASIASNQSAADLVGSSFTVTASQTTALSASTEVVVVSENTNSDALAASLDTSTLTSALSSRLPGVDLSVEAPQVFTPPKPPPPPPPSLPPLYPGQPFGPPPPPKADDRPVDAVSVLVSFWWALLIIAIVAIFACVAIVWWYARKRYGTQAAAKNLFLGVAPTAQNLGSGIGLGNLFSMPPPVQPRPKHYSEATTVVWTKPTKTVEGSDVEGKLEDDEELHSRPTSSGSGTISSMEAKPLGYADALALQASTEAMAEVAAEAAQVAQEEVEAAKAEAEKAEADAADALVAAEIARGAARGESAEVVLARLEAREAKLASKKAVSQRLVVGDLEEKLEAATLDSLLESTPTRQKRSEQPELADSTEGDGAGTRQAPSLGLQGGQPAAPGRNGGAPTLSSSRILASSASADLRPGYNQVTAPRAPSRGNAPAPAGLLSNMMALDDPEDDASQYSQNYPGASRGGTPRGGTPRGGAPGDARLASGSMNYGSSAVLANWHARRNPGAMMQQASMQQSMMQQSMMQQQMMMQQSMQQSMHIQPGGMSPMMGTSNVSSSGTRTTAELIAEAAARRTQQSMMQSGGGSMAQMSYRPTVPVATTNVSSTGARTTAELIAEAQARRQQMPPPAGTNVSSTGARTTAELVAEAQAKKAAAGTNVSSTGARTTAELIAEAQAKKLNQI